MLSQQRLNGTHVPWNNVTGLRSGNKVESKWESDFLSSSIRSLFLASSSNSTPFYRTRQRRHDYSSLSLRRVQDERKRERERRSKTWSNLRSWGEWSEGRFPPTTPPPPTPLYSLYFKPSSRLPPETGTRVKSLFPSCSFSLSLLLESCCRKVLLGEMLSSLGKGREGKGWKGGLLMEERLMYTCDTRSEKGGIRSFFSFIYFFFLIDKVDGWLTFSNLLY